MFLTDASTEGENYFVFAASSTNMAKACVIQRQGQTTVSVLSLLQKEKNLLTSSKVGFKDNFPCGNDSLLNIVECDEVCILCQRGMWWLSGSRRV
jgi:hypothetical protein